MHGQKPKAQTLLFLIPFKELFFFHGEQAFGYYT